MNRVVYILFFAFALTLVKAQDPHFTQFYAAPQYLNPAFTGLTDQHRFTANYRNQWPGINRAFQTYMAGYEYNLNPYNSGFGICVLQDKAGTGGLTHTQAAFNYSYRLEINKDAEIRAGISASYNMMRLGFSKLLFTDQIVQNSATSLEQNNYQQKNYLDLGTGVLYNSKNFWGGVTVRHLNNPNYSLVKQNAALPIYIGAQGGYKLFLSKSGRSESSDSQEDYVMIAANYYHQNKFDQLDIGAYYCHSPFTVGLWYRGLPLKTYAPGYPFSESIVLLTGYEIIKEKLKVGYSYDFTISKLKINNSKGAHEISLVYEFGVKTEKKSVSKGTKSTKSKLPSL